MTLYQGGQYFLYKYKRYDDVRLVFAPEDDIAAFGGDPDNFQFPRWWLDMSRAARLRERQAGEHARSTCKFNCDGPAEQASWCSSPGIPAPPTAC